MDKVPSMFRSLKELYLNYNKIVSLTGIQGFECLSVFHIKNNLITSLDEFSKVENKYHLTNLNVKGNPIDSNSLCNYVYFKELYFSNLKYFNLSDEKHSNSNRNQLEFFSDIQQSEIQYSDEKLYRKHLFHTSSLHTSAKKEDGYSNPDNSAYHTEKK